MIVSYNLEAVGDTLIIVIAEGKNKDVSVVKQGNVACILDKETDQILGWNIFEASHHITNLKGNGQIELSPSQITELNLVVKEAGFAHEFEVDNTPKFVVGYVHTSVPHEDSDHLTVNDIEVDNGEHLQIVCGAPNIKAGLKVVVAKVGAMMPDGLIIWPGELRGVESFGMVCSAKELRLPNAPQEKGILELDDSYEVGTRFNLPQ
ncbi:YtpR family tRNA-binding protein [Vagococcus sp. JNUCC 83]